MDALDKLAHHLLYFSAPDYKYMKQLVSKLKTRSGIEYGLTEAGTRVRLSPRPYRGKSERRAVIKQRRVEKE